MKSYEILKLKKSIDDGDDDKLSFWRYFFRVSYFLFVSPHKFEKDSYGQYYCYERRGKIIWAFALLVSLLIELRGVQIRLMLLSQGQEFTKYFEMTRNFGVIILLLVVMITLFLKKNTFLKIFEKGESLGLFFSSSLQFRLKKKASFTLYSSIQSSKFQSVISLVLFLGCFNIYTIARYLRAILIDGNFPWTQYREKSIENFNLNQEEYIVLGEIVLFLNHILSNFIVSVANLLLVTASLYLHKVVNSFIELTKIKTSTLKILETYKNVHELIELNNDAIGPAVLIFGIYAIPSNAAIIFRALDSDNFSLNLLYTWLIIGFNAQFFIAAGLNKKMEYAKEWLYQNNNFDRIPCSDLAMILDDLSNEQLGLSGLGVFTISYKFIGSMIGTTFSLCIIMLQFKSPVGSKA